MTNYVKKVGRGTIITFTALMFSAFIVYLTRVFLAHNLTIEEYGLFYAVFTFVIFISLFQDFGLRGALVKFIPEWKVKKKPENIKNGIVTVFLFHFIVALIIVFLLFLFSDFLAEYYFRNQMASLLLKILSIYILITIFDELLKRAFQGFQRMDLFSFMEAGKTVIIFTLVITLVSLNFGLLAPVYSYILGGPLIFLLSIRFFMKIYPFFKHKMKLSKTLTTNMLFFGFPLIFTVFANKIIESFDILILVYYRSLADIAVYNVVLATSTLILFFSRPLALIMLPVGSELWSRNLKTKLSRSIINLHRYSFALIVPPILILGLYSPLFLKIFFGDDFIRGSFPMQILLISSVFMGVAYINNSVISGSGKSKITAGVIIISAIINIIFNILLIPEYGMVGAAIATSISYICAFILSSIFLSKLIEIDYTKVKYFRILIASVLMLVVISFVKHILTINVWLEVVLTGVIGISVYLILLFVLKILDYDELKGLVKSVL